jgi:alcohol dehydrogenase class IV
MMQFNFPTVLLFGENSINDLPSEIKKKNLHSLLLVTDPGLVEIGLADAVREKLTSSGLEIRIFDGVHPNPLEEDVTLGVAAYQSGNYDGIIALGGGSSLDVAKTIRFMTVHQPPLSQYDDAVGGDAKIINSLPPMYAIPTTAGTGSEVGRSSVITIQQTGRKTIFFHPGLMPDIAVLDPVLTVGLPSNITAATGMDAFTHCMEAYLVDSFHPMADAIAIEGMKMIIKNLPKVMENPNNLDARGQMLLSATMGATAFQKGLGMIHSMAHPLSAKHNIHHGLANALLIKFVLEFTINKAITTENQRLLSKLETIGDLISSNTLDNISYTPDILSTFINNIEIQLGLGEHGIVIENVANLAKLAFEDSCHATHPFPVTIEDFTAVYTRAL